jgi:hypothetical protein
MDYPKSVPNVGLVGGKFVDENTATGVVGSLIPSVWGNNVTDELLSVLSAAGIAPSEAETDQLLKAIRSKTLLLTQPLFDATKAAATTEFVQQAAGNLSGGLTVANGSSAVASYAGKFLSVGAGGSFLPPTGAVANGASLHYKNTGLGPHTLSRVGADSISGAGPLLTTIVIDQGEDLRLVRVSDVWIATGSAALKYAAGFGALLTANGWQKLPSGLIIQCGQVTTSATASVAVTFPIAFPSNVMETYCSANANTASFANLYTPSVSGASIDGWSNAGARVAINARWLAIGF